MNRLLYKLTVFFTLPAMLVAVAGCAKEEWTAPETAGEETIVSFTASVVSDAATKAAETYNEYKLVCAVFEDGLELEAVREVVPIVGGKADFSPRLIKGHTYTIVFWAMKEGVYNVDSMENIFLNAAAEHSDADAFTACTEYTVTEVIPAAVSLVRPLSRVNLGMSIQSEGRIPERVVMEIESYSGYDAVNGSFVGEASIMEYSSYINGGELVVNDVTYKLLMSCHPFANDAASRLKYTIYGRDSETGEESVISSRTINAVPLLSNYVTNIVGNLLD